MAQDQIVSEYASEVVSALDLHKPEIYNKLFLSLNGQSLPFHQKLRSMGLEEDAAQDKVEHFEELKIHSAFKSRGAVDDNIAGDGDISAGDSVYIELHADNVDSNGNYYPRVGQICKFPGSNVKGRIQAIDVTANAGTSSAVVRLTVKPVLSTDTLPDLTTGQTVVLLTNAHGEGSGQPKGVFVGAVKREYYLQIIKETTTVTGTEKTNQSWVNGWEPVDAPTPGGGSRKAFYHKGIFDSEYRLSQAIDGAYWEGPRGDGHAKDDNTRNGVSRPVYTMEGLFPVTRRLGMSDAPDISAFTLLDFDLYDRMLKTQYNHNKYVYFGMGNNLYQGVENAMATLNGIGDNANNNAAFLKANDEKMFDGNATMTQYINFTKFVKSGRCWNFDDIEVFADGEVFNATGHGGDTKGIIMPMGSDKDPKSGKYLPRIKIRYKGLGQYSRRLELWQDGTAGTQLKIGQYDDATTYWRTNQGLQYMGVNNNIIIEGTNAY